MPVDSYSCVAYRINNNGRVVGFSFGAGVPSFRATLLDPAGAHDVGALPGYSSSYGHGINDLGQIIGRSFSVPRVRDCRMSSPMAWSSAL